MTRSRLVALVFLVAVVAGFVLWRGRPVLPGAAPSRGGQLVGSIRAEPRTFNRLVARDPIVEIVALLTQGRLVRVNRNTFELEPGLAERWEMAADGRTYTVHLRRGLTWSDGVPFTSADVLFTLEAVFDPKAHAILASAMVVGDKPITATAPDASTVVFTYPAAYGPGLRILDNLWILPKHKLEPALRAGTFSEAWHTRTSPADLVGTGPFILREYQPGQRLVFARNPRYWRTDASGTALPYLDTLVLEIVPDQNAEIIRLTSGNIDFTQSEIRPDDYLPLKRAADRGGIRLLDLGIGPDADSFWFCLKPEAWAGDPKFAFVQRPEFRQAISHAVNREDFAENVFLGAAVPIWGPVTPGNKPWFSPNVPRYPYDPARASALLRGLELEDRNADGVVEDRAGTPARFTMITQRGNTALERGALALRDDLAKVGIALDVAPLELGAMLDRMLNSKYEAIYFRVLATDLDPAMNLDMWLSTGSARFWHFGQQGPSSDWEREVDRLMLEQAAASDPERRRELFDQVQRTFAENLPVLYFVAPRLYYAHSTRVRGAIPSVIRPPILWNADTLSVAQK